MELPPSHDARDIELVERTLVKGPPKSLAEIAAKVLITSRVPVSEKSTTIAQQKFEEILDTLPADCHKYVEKSLWAVQDPCIKANDYKNFLGGAYNASVAFAELESSHVHITVARYGTMILGESSRVIIECDTGRVLFLDDVIATQVGSKSQQHCIDFARKSVFSDDGKYVVFKTHPLDKTRAHISYLSIYNRHAGSWKSLCAPGDSVSFFDTHRFAVRSAQDFFYCVDCDSESIVPQSLFSVSGATHGGWSPCGEGIIRNISKKVFFYFPDDSSTWKSWEFELPSAPIGLRAVAKRRGIFAYSHRRDGVLFVSFASVTSNGCDVVADIPIIEDDSTEDLTIREFFADESLLAVEICSRNLMVIIGCADIKNPHIIKKLKGPFAGCSAVIHQMLYIGNKVIMPNILLSYYAAYKKKLTQPKASPCILS